METIFKWGGKVAIMVGPIGVLGMLVAQQDKLGATFYWLLGAFTLITIFGVIGMIVDLKPWKWRVFQRQALRTIAPSNPKRYRDESGRPLCPKEDTFGELDIAWKSHNKYGEAGYSRERFQKFRELPEIEELACEVFEHQAFTSDTYNRLVSWLLTNHLASDRNEMLAMPRSEVVRLLREAVSTRH